MLTFMEYQDYKYEKTGVHYSGRDLHTEYGHYVKKFKEGRMKALKNLVESEFRKSNVSIESGSEKITKNACKCKICGDVIESKSVHDFVQCSCGRIFTDGGKEYIRRGFIDLDDLIDLTEYEINKP